MNTEIGDEIVEKAVLGSLILTGNSYWEVSDILSPAVFAYPDHRMIYTAIMSLAIQHKPIDILTLKNQLAIDGVLDRVGGVYYLSELSGKVSSSANIRHHASVLIQAWMLRKIEEVGKIMIDRAKKGLDGNQIVTWARAELELNIATPSATSFTDLLPKVRDKVEDNAKKAVSGKTIGVPGKLRDVNEITSGYHNGDLIIIAARPAMGKSAYSVMEALASAWSGVPVAFFSLEMDKIQIGIRLVAAETEVDAYRMRTGNMYDWDNAKAEWSSISFEKINTYKVAFPNSADIYVDDTPALSIMDLRAKGRRLKAEKNIGMIIIDYLQLMTGTGGNGSLREQEISGITRSLKELAKELDLPIIALSQLSRAVETRGGDKKPILSDLRESGAIEQDADMVMFLYRPEYYGLTTYENGASTEDIAEVLIAKQRNGPTGDVKVIFDKKRITFGDMNTLPAANGDNNYPF